MGESESEVTQLCPTLSDPMDRILPGFFILGPGKTYLHHLVYQFFINSLKHICCHIAPLLKNFS